MNDVVQTSNERSYRSVKGVIANLVESLEDERDRLAHEVERLTLHSTMQQHLIDKLAERNALETPEQLPSPYSALSQGSLDVLIERARQISAEGWTPEHDDSHPTGELAQAAACYALRAGGIHLRQAHDLWPWSDSWWKPKDSRRDLVRAAALIIAEIDRLYRKSSGVSRTDADEHGPTCGCCVCIAEEVRLVNAQKAEGGGT